jgi:hypothetical protein
VAGRHKERDKMSKVTGFTARVKAFFSEFPFLDRYMRPENLWEVPKVSRFNLDLVDQKGHTKEYLDLLSKGDYGSWSGLRNNWGLSHQFFLIDANGQELKAVEPSDVAVEDATPCYSSLSCWKKLAFWFTPKDCWERRSEKKGETIQDSILGLDDPNRVMYVLEIVNRSLYVSWPPQLCVTIHKIPKGRSFSEWINDLRRVAEEELFEAIKEIDTGISK